MPDISRIIAQRSASQHKRAAFEVDNFENQSMDTDNIAWPKYLLILLSSCVNQLHGRVCLDNTTLYFKIRFNERAT